MLLSGNSQIYHLLESSDRLFSDFSSDRVLVFDHEDDLYVVLYTAADRNFTAYAACGHAQRPGALAELLQEIQDDPNLVPHLRNEAILLVEDVLHSQNNSRFFFDAH